MVPWHDWPNRWAGNLGVAPIDATPEAWAILDDERRFVEVSRALAEIAELPAHRMVGHPVEDFSNPDDPTIRDDIARPRRVPGRRDRRAERHRRLRSSPPLRELI
jgi:PAS domain-containing protein